MKMVNRINVEVKLSLKGRLQMFAMKAYCVLLTLSEPFVGTETACVAWFRAMEGFEPDCRVRALPSRD